MDALERFSLERLRWDEGDDVFHLEPSVACVELLWSDRFECLSVRRESIDDFCVDRDESKNEDEAPFVILSGRSAMTNARLTLRDVFLCVPDAVRILVDGFSARERENDRASIAGVTR